MGIAVKYCYGRGARLAFEERAAETIKKNVWLLFIAASIPNFYAAWRLMSGHSYASIDGEVPGVVALGLGALLLLAGSALIARKIRRRGP